jgi:dipeptide/tripeptide permease
MNQNQDRKHPRALPFLFFSEMWERFGYYLMIGIFTLYLKDVKEGFGMTEAEASDLYGTFIALVFLTPFLGGLLADRYFGYRKSIIFGGILMAIGYCMMFFSFFTHFVCSDDNGHHREWFFQTKYFNITGKCVQQS